MADVTNDYKGFNPMLARDDNERPASGVLGFPCQVARISAAPLQVTVTPQDGPPRTQTFYVDALDKRVVRVDIDW